ncbi:MAG: hypothetical protein ACRC3H_00645 [Lachnospiraceae bacterium]
MLSLTFAEQVKIILSRRHMTIKQLAEIIEEKTGGKMSRQNLTQRLNRDNFQEQDMRMIADILGCSFQLNILDTSIPVEPGIVMPTEEELEKLNRRRSHAVGKKEISAAGDEVERDITMGELVDMMSVTEAEIERLVEDMPEGRTEDTDKSAVSESVIKTVIKDEVEQNVPQEEAAEKETKKGFHFAKPNFSFGRTGTRRQEYKEEPAVVEQEEMETEDLNRGEINPYTRQEYQTNSVRIHPKRIGYVQVYDRSEHKWTDMTEWAFLGYQERKKALLGNDYEPPIYLD